mgnify:CR=1 FL=1
MKVICQKTQKAELNRASIKLVEAIDNNEQFTVALQDKPFEFVGYSKNGRWERLR